VPNPNPPLENLKPIQPGEVRNPNGSSNKQRLTNALIQFLERGDISDLPDNIRQFIETGFSEAVTGNVGYWREIFTRIDGKPPEPEPPAAEVNMEEVARRIRDKRQKRKPQ
jgi:hypothetical protein